MRPDDTDLLRALHDEHGRALWSYVVGLTNGDRAQAQDVVQETLLRAWRNPQVLAQPRAARRAGWLFTVAKRIVIDEWRTARSRRERVTDDVPERPVADDDRPRRRPPASSRRMRTLSADHRAVLHECYFRGSSVTEAAAGAGHPARHRRSRAPTTPCARCGSPSRRWGRAVT